MRWAMSQSLSSKSARAGRIAAGFGGDFIARASTPASRGMGIRRGRAPGDLARGAVA
jgi:hypothetical protein